jgi:hypothetical protein
MTKWDYLFEGKALGPSPSMRKTAQVLTTHITSSLKKWVRKWEGKVEVEEDIIKALEDLIKRLNKKQAATVGRKKDPHGKKRIWIDYEMRGVGDIVSAGTGPVDETSALGRQGFHFHVVIMFRIEHLGDLIEGDAMVGDMVKTVHRVVAHEMLHTIDPKTQPAFVKEQTAYRTRKGFNPGFSEGNVHASKKSLEAYILHPVEQEAWVRDLTSHLISRMYERSKSVSAVDAMTRKPPILYSEVTHVWGPDYDYSLMELWDRSPKRWRRFLRTLRDEFEVFAKDPKTYVRYH